MRYETCLTEDAATGEACPQAGKRCLQSRIVPMPGDAQSVDYLHGGRGCIAADQYQPVGHRPSKLSWVHWPVRELQRAGRWAGGGSSDLMQHMPGLAAHTSSSPMQRRHRCSPQQLGNSVQLPACTPAHLPTSPPAAAGRPPGSCARCAPVAAAPRAGCPPLPHTQSRGQ
jgi:hypothetical protein